MKQWKMYADTKGQFPFSKCVALGCLFAARALTRDHLFLISIEKRLIEVKTTTEAGLNKLFVYRHPTDPTLEVPTQNILLDREKQNFSRSKKFPKVTDYFKVKFYFLN